MEDLQNKIAVYIHIPFCTKICSYCDFCKVYYNKKWINDYLDALEKEIVKGYKNDFISSLYIGGGTPSSLDNDELNRLFNILKVFKLTKNAEITFECNLNDINDYLLDILVNNKVNRLSIGIQSFNKKNLSLMNRDGSYKEAKEKINLCKKKGITNINIDLIYALPFEKISTLKKDLKLFKKLDIPHISTYSLILEEKTVLYNKGITPIKEEIDYKMYKIICNTLKKWGYSHYEISNFAKDGYSSKHNLTYWHNENYYGFGVSASGYLKNKRYTNTHSLTSYIKGDNNKDEEILSKEDTIKYELILGFRLTNGINIDDFKKKYNMSILDYPNIKILLDNNDLLIKNGNIFINPDKLYIENEILTKLI